MDLLSRGVRNSSFLFDRSFGTTSAPFTVTHGGGGRTTVMLTRWGWRINTPGFIDTRQSSPTGRGERTWWYLVGQPFPRSLRYDVVIPLSSSISLGCLLKRKILCLKGGNWKTVTRNDIESLQDFYPVASISIVDFSIQFSRTHTKWSPWF